jgi:mono/diheme cytochrome c family protein
MRNRFYFWILFLSGLVILIFALLAAYREISPEWSKYQAEYKSQLVNTLKDEAAKKKALALTAEVQQLYLRDLQRIDRCTSCHVGVENPLMAKAKAPLMQHSGDYLTNHSLEKFGCTVCHYGQGRATNRMEAHGIGHETHWDFPVIPAKYIQSACVQCHDAGTLQAKGWDSVAQGEKLVNEKGCRGCHKLDGAGGVLGKALAGVGSKPIAYFPMGAVEGEKTTYAWFKQHFIDPRKLVPVSEMKVTLTDEEADHLTTFVLALRSGEMPKQYRRFKDSPVAELSATDGEVLYKKYCVACHAKGKDSMFDEIFSRTIPSIMNPAFLKTADNKLLKKIVEEGRTGTQMTSWKPAAAGLSDQEIEAIVQYLGKDRPTDRPAVFGYAQYKADAKHGEEVYKIRCWFCHGTKGEGGLGLNLRNPVVQGYDTEFIATTVRDGRKDTPMPPFGKNGVKLGDQDIVDVVAFVKTLAQRK